MPIALPVRLLRQLLPLIMPLLNAEQDIPRWNATLENFRRASEPRSSDKSAELPDEDIAGRIWLPLVKSSQPDAVRELDRPASISAMKAVTKLPCRDN